MGAMASRITSLTIVYSTVYSDADQREHQSSASLALLRETHRWPVTSPHKWPVTRKMFPFDDVIMCCHYCCIDTSNNTTNTIIMSYFKHAINDVLKVDMMFCDNMKRFGCQATIWYNDLGGWKVFIFSLCNAYPIWRICLEKSNRTLFSKRFWPRIRPMSILGIGI